VGKALSAEDGVNGEHQSRVVVLFEDLVEPDLQRVGILILSLVAEDRVELGQPQAQAVVELAGVLFALLEGLFDRLDGAAGKALGQVPGPVRDAVARVQRVDHPPLHRRFRGALRHRPDQLLHRERVQCAGAGDQLHRIELPGLLRHVEGEPAKVRAGRHLTIGVAEHVSDLA